VNHISKSVSLINKKLSTKEATADATIAAVVNLTIHAQLQDDAEYRKVHMDGLERLVGLRGGMVALEGNLALLQKICRYHRPSLSFSHQQG
jgi:hypothetical protein